VEFECGEESCDDEGEEGVSYNAYALGKGTRCLVSSHSIQGVK
jgi:hypothetical protein